MRRSITRGGFITLSTAFLLAAAPTAAAPRPDRGDSTSTRRLPAVRPTLDDATIVAIFDAANTADIETGRLAAERGRAKAVRDYGAMIASDHDALRQLGRDLAKKLGVTPTPPADDTDAKAHTEAMDLLRGVRGVEFDRAFLKHEVAFHQGVIDAIETSLLPAIQNEELRALVVKVVPALQAHMIAAQNLEKELSRERFNSSMS
jgi:putative membrane protein